MTTREELLALLREARARIDDPDDCSCSECRGVATLLARIDAALLASAPASGEQLSEKEANGARLDTGPAGSDPLPVRVSAPAEVAAGEAVLSQREAAFRRKAATRAAEAHAPKHEKRRGPRCTAKTRRGLPCDRAAFAADGLCMGHAASRWNQYAKQQKAQRLDGSQEALVGAEIGKPPADAGLAMTAAHPSPSPAPAMMHEAKLSPPGNCDCGLLVETHATLTGAPREHKLSCRSRIVLQAEGVLSDLAPAAIEEALSRSSGSLADGSSHFADGTNQIPHRPPPPLSEDSTTGRSPPAPAGLALRNAVLRLLRDGMGPGGGSYGPSQRLRAAVDLLECGWGIGAIRDEWTEAERLREALTRIGSCCLAREAPEADPMLAECCDREEHKIARAALASSPREGAK